LAIFSLILIALGLIAALFRPSRFLINLFLEKVYLLPLIWIGMVLANEVTIFFIDYIINGWAKNGQERDPSSNRYTLRASTYSQALGKGTTIFFTIVGIALTLGVIGLNSSVLASAGVLAAVLAYLSRNVLEDMINGVLILATDRYAVGDVVDVGVGFVEDMNLYATSLRNLDGQVLVIPNGTISRVINMTKNWSRVNLTLKISWNADVKKAIEVIRQVGEQMLSEPQWQEIVLEPLEILGIDELSHDGILIRLLIKTLPMQQWLVSREFRLRVKQALDEAGISLGVPQREVAVIQSAAQSSEDHSNQLLGEVKEGENSAFKS
jgi:small conductance mechanosensitive channel